MKYLKLFIAVFAAVYLATTVSALTQDYLISQVYGYFSSDEYAFTESAYPEPLELASVAVAPVQVASIDDTKTITVPSMSAQKRAAIQQSMRKDWEACKYWSRSHIIRATYKSKYDMEQACGRYNDKIKNGM